MYKVQHQIEKKLAWLLYVIIPISKGNANNGVCEKYIEAAGESSCF